MRTDKKSIIQKMCETMQRMRYAYKTENGYCVKPQEMRRCVVVMQNRLVIYTNSMQYNKKTCWQQLNKQECIITALL
jgi:hypothetical protein